jgi:LysR family transcriptional regulator, glycine cleavage system transcriptional activator
MSLPPLATLRAFEAAACLGSFVRAAEQINVTPAAISQHVKTLERWLGQLLFRRHAQGVELTPAGHELSAAVTDGLARIALVANRLRHEQFITKVCIGCISSVATRWLIPRLPAFEHRHPDIRLHVVYAGDTDTPASTGTDLLIRHGNRPNDTAHPLLNAATRPVCTPAYLAAASPLNSPRDLRKAPLLHDANPQAWQTWLTQAGVTATAPLRGTVFQDAALTASACLHGQGIALLPTALFADACRQGSLTVLFPTATDQDKHYWLLQRDNLSPAATLFRNWLVAVAADR